MTSLRVVIFLVLSWGLTPAPIQGQPVEEPPSGAQPAQRTDNATTPGPETLSDAEQIARLQRSIDESQKILDGVKKKLEDPESEYVRAEAEFNGADAELQNKQRALDKVKDTGQPQEQARLEKEIEEFRKTWQLAKDRFELAIQERKVLNEQIATLETKIKQDTDALNKLRGITQPPADPAAQPGGAAPAAPTTEGQPAAAPSDNTSATPPAGGLLPIPGVTPQQGTPADKPAAARPPSKELVEAQQEAQAKEAAAQQAEEEAESLQQRIDSLQRSIANDRELLKTARQQAQNAQEALNVANAEVEKTMKGADPAALGEAWVKLRESRERLYAANAEADAILERISRNQTELADLQSMRIAALQEAEQKRVAAEEARKRVEKLENPFALTNMLNWVLLHGPRLVFTVLGMLALLWVSRWAETKLVHVLARGGDRGSLEERENRAKTLVGVFHNAATIVIIVGGGLMILSEIGINVIPLLGAAGFIGLAVAFGAQNLIRDYFSGFMILMENQYGVNDVIKIGESSGLVERITLRLTVLRDLEGTVHFIPNGQIDKVSNMTHGWSRALFDIGVAYKEDLDRVMNVLTELGKGLRKDPAYTDLILDNPEMLGVDQFGDSAVVIKFFIKTRPLKQWPVKREMLRRIKKRFDEIGIEIPFPHRTVFHHYTNGPVPPTQEARREEDVHEGAWR